MRAFYSSARSVQLRLVLNSARCVTCIHSTQMMTITTCVSALLVVVFGFRVALGRARVLVFTAVYSRSISCLSVVDRVSGAIYSSVCSLACQSADSDKSVEPVAVS